jgi:N-acetylglucosamine kinase-like BadF-type ATPase
MVAVVRACDGRGAETKLKDLVFHAFGIRDIAELPGKTDSEESKRRKIAALAPGVIDFASKGDAAACEILDAGASELRLLVETAVRRLGFTTGPIPLVITGGLGEADTLYRERILRKLSRIEPPVELKNAVLPPVGGAVLLAWRRLPGIAGEPDLAGFGRRLKEVLNPTR